jgi:prevent-host-death family protein
MPTYGTLEAKNRFSELIERAERGEEVVITRHGKPVVKFHVIGGAEEQRERAREALERIKRRSNRIKTGMTNDEIMAYIREGRR